AKTRIGLVDAVMEDGVGRELLDELGDVVLVSGVEPPKHAAPQPAARGEEVAAGDLGDVVAVLEQLCGTRAQLAPHTRDEHAHDYRAPSPGSDSGRSSGNRITSRMVVTPASSITRRSTPMPSPAHGGGPD